MLPEAAPAGAKIAPIVAADSSGGAGPPVAIAASADADTCIMVRINDPPNTRLRQRKLL